METASIPYNATTKLVTGKILVLAAHPDDEVFGCAGAIMQHLAQGDELQVAIITDGQAAMPYQNAVYRQAYISQRQQESLQAAKVLAYGSPIFLDIADRQLVCDAETVERLAAIVSSQAIQHLYAPSMFEIHPDHLALAQIALQLANKYQIGLSMYEVGVPLQPNQLLDITRFWPRKKAAMACFNSQLAIQRYDKHINGLNVYRSYTLPPSVQAAEAYYLVKGNENWQNLLHTLQQFRS